jgi:cytoskeletal protein CcmA (bactofilin family)
MARGGEGKGDARIGANAKVHGRIAGDGDLTVEGRVDGDIALRGELTVADGGVVAAEHIEADGITVAGRLEGEMHVSGVVRVLAGARIKGDVLNGGTLSLEEGAEFAGRIENEFDLPPELESGSGTGRQGRR